MRLSVLYMYPSFEALHNNDTYQRVREQVERVRDYMRNL